ncbi:hypothetical protein Tco_0418546 [Tanacetum coccineum]
MSATAKVLIAEYASAPTPPSPPPSPLSPLSSHFPQIPSPSLPLPSSPTTSPHNLGNHMATEQLDSVGKSQHLAAGARQPGIDVLQVDPPLDELCLESPESDQIYPLLCWRYHEIHVLIRGHPGRPKPFQEGSIATQLFGEQIDIIFTSTAGARGVLHYKSKARSTMQAWRQAHRLQPGDTYTKDSSFDIGGSDFIKTDTLTKALCTSSDTGGMEPALNDDTKNAGRADIFYPVRHVKYYRGEIRSEIFEIWKLKVQGTLILQNHSAMFPRIGINDPGGLGKRNSTEDLNLCALNATTIMMDSVLPSAPIAKRTGHLTQDYRIQPATANNQRAQGLQNEHVVIAKEGLKTIGRRRRLEKYLFFKDFPNVLPKYIYVYTTNPASGISNRFSTCVAPIARAPYRLAPSEMKELSDQCRNYPKQKAIIKTRSSPWGAPYLVVKKKDCIIKVPSVHRIASKGIHRRSLAKIESIKDWASPKTATEIHQFFRPSQANLEALTRGNKAQRTPHAEELVRNANCKLKEKVRIAADGTLF